MGMSKQKTIRQPCPYPFLPAWRQIWLLVPLFFLIYDGIRNLQNCWSASYHLNDCRLKGVSNTFVVQIEGQYLPLALLSDPRTSAILWSSWMFSTITIEGTSVTSATSASNLLVI